MNISDIRYLYRRQYPGFVALCEQITQEALAASEALTEQQKAMVASRHNQGTPLPSLDELRRQQDEIWTTCNQRHEQIRKEMGVPLLQNWDQALAVTGKAVYHDFYPDQGSSRRATLTRLEDGRVVIEAHLTRTYAPDGEIGLHLPVGFDPRAWEAMKPLDEKEVKLQIIARAMADAKYDLACSTDANAGKLAEAEYQRLMEDHARNGENSELSRFINKDQAKWTAGLEKPGSMITLTGKGIYLDIQRREDMKFDTKGRTPEQTLQGATEDEVSTLLKTLGYDDRKLVSWP